MFPEPYRVFLHARIRPLGEVDFARDNWRAYLLDLLREHEGPRSLYHPSLSFVNAAPQRVEWSTPQNAEEWLPERATRH